MIDHAAPQSYQDSFGARIMLDDLPELTLVALMHSVKSLAHITCWRCELEPDAGYCHCFDSLDRSESQSLSLVIQFRLLFWTADAELSLANLSEITSKLSFSLLAYDTLEDWQHNINNVNADHDLVGQGSEYQSRIVRQSEHLAAVAKGCHPTSHGRWRKPPILGLVVSPWTTVK